ncbi:acyl-CoA carboxylase subunit epsilon [Cryptosporangium phraense]|uniref:Acyl-CoA carboxylase subunit epsilon n=1 Tax=Cryptosporangium phraense TaxID=2593070 RepID=A0A545AV21_9ACTN|nr:acyl-CoA carboxylase subunit epsilon [Cryptosporangium phraense]TQS45164.1 acyl-CoA carboxylase subunit epsilon [Cryptosporangium phraense]
MTTDDAGTEPVLRILRGVPTAEELAALVGVLAARSAAVTPAAPQARELWRRKEARVGAPLVAGPGAWRASGLPR